MEEVKAPLDEFETQVEADSHAADYRIAEGDQQFLVPFVESAAAAFEEMVAEQKKAIHLALKLAGYPEPLEPEKYMLHISADGWYIVRK